MMALVVPSSVAAQTLAAAVLFRRIGNGGVWLVAVGCALAGQSALLAAPWHPWAVGVSLCCWGAATLGFPAASGLIFDHVPSGDAAGGEGPPPCLRTAARPAPAWCLHGLGSLLRVLEDRPSSLEAYGGFRPSPLSSRPRWRPSTFLHLPPPSSMALLHLPAWRSSTCHHQAR